jgi:hypothetical protein
MSNINKYKVSSDRCYTESNYNHYNSPYYKNNSNLSSHYNHNKQSHNNYDTSLCHYNKDKNDYTKNTPHRDDSVFDYKSTLFYKQYFKKDSKTKAVEFVNECKTVNTNIDYRISQLIVTSKSTTIISMDMIYYRILWIQNRLSFDNSVTLIENWPVTPDVIIELVNYKKILLSLFNHCKIFFHYEQYINPNLIINDDELFELFVNCNYVNSRHQNLLQVILAEEYYRYPYNDFVINLLDKVHISKVILENEDINCKNSIYTAKNVVNCKKKILSIILNKQNGKMRSLNIESSSYIEKKKYQMTSCFLRGHHFIDIDVASKQLIKINNISYKRSGSEFLKLLLEDFTFYSYILARNLMYVNMFKNVFDNLEQDYDNGIVENFNNYLVNVHARKLKNISVSMINFQKFVITLFEKINKKNQLLCFKMLVDSHKIEDINYIIHKFEDVAGEFIRNNYSNCIYYPQILNIIGKTDTLQPCIKLIINYWCKKSNDNVELRNKIIDYLVNNMNRVSNPIFSSHDLDPDIDITSILLGFSVDVSLVFFLKYFTNFISHRLNPNGKFVIRFLYENLNQEIFFDIITNINRTNKLVININNKSFKNLNETIDKVRKLPDRYIYDYPLHADLTSLPFLIEYGAILKEIENN